MKVAGAEIVDDGGHWSSFSGALYVPEPRRLLAGLGSSLIFSGSDAGLNSEPWKLDPADKTRSVT